MSGNARPVRKRIRGTFWDHVDKTGDCWVWTGARTSTGYGNCKFDGATTKAHRASWIMANGPIPDGLLVCHRCDNRPCVRPDHLFLGTNSDNLRDSVAKGRYMSERRRTSAVAAGERQRGRPGLPGERNPNAKLTLAAVADIRRRYATGAVYQSTLAIEHGVSQVLISHIVRGVSWRE